MTSIKDTTPTTSQVGRRLEGRLAVITGGASGIGAETVRLFAAEGATVLAVDCSEAQLMEAHAGSASVHTLVLDLTATDAPQAVIAAALDALGGIDILFNNAGTAIVNLAEATTDEEWDHVFSVNTRAMFRLTREAIPVLKKHAELTGRGRIINVASVMAECTDIGQIAYTASKHAVAGLTKTLALELGKFNITANCILPGAIVTGLTRDNFEQDHIRQAWEKKAALRRLGQPIDIARAVLLLASPEADFITGHGLVVDGGLTLRA